MNSLLNSEISPQGRQSPHALPMLRTLLGKGWVDEARSLIEKLRPQTADQIRASVAEVCLEEARLATHQAEWSRAVEICDCAVGLQPASLTQMALLQIRAVALFERGDFAKA